MRSQQETKRGNYEHDQTYQTSARYRTTGEDDRRYRDGGRKRSDDAAGLTGGGVCAQRRIEGRPSESGGSSTAETQSHRGLCRPKTLEESKRELNQTNSPGLPSAQRTKFPADGRLLAPRAALAKLAPCRAQFMTVCIAALADGAIICVADKALTYGQSIQWDADASKITTLDNGKSLILLAGDDSPTNRLLRKINHLTDEFSGDQFSLMSILEQAMKDAFSEEQEICVLHPEMLTKDGYLKALCGPKRSIQKYTRYRLE